MHVHVRAVVISGHHTVDGSSLVSGNIQILIWVVFVRKAQSVVQNTRAILFLDFLSQEFTVIAGMPFH